jgi:SAM-dependent methyltransferase
MGDINQYQFISEQRDRLSGPFLEIGSRDYGSTQDLRSLFPGEEYVGVDLSEGPGVDAVLDLTQPFDVIDKALGLRRFGTIFSLSVMEHCENPFLMAENMTRLLAPGGKVVLSVPFAWKFHGYPSDYWRFTAEGVKKLFPQLDWDAEGRECWHSPKKGDFRRVDEFVGMAPLSGRYYRERGETLRGVGADFLKVFRSLGLFRWLLGYRYLMLPTMINMVGVLRKDVGGRG